MSERLIRIKHLLSLKERQELEAFNKLTKARTLQQQTDAKRKQLLSFSTEYTSQIETLGKSGVQVSALKNRIRFVQQLEKAQQQLDAQLNQIEEALLLHEKKWQKAKMEYDGVEKLLDRISREEEARQLIQEQKENDEYAQKLWHDKHNRNQ